MEKRSLIKLAEGEFATVANFSNDKIGSKLIARGVLPESQITIVRSAPFGGGFYVKVDGQNMAVRTEEAACIMITA